MALAANFVSAQTYPAKPVRVIIPWPPGGSNDIVGRIVAQKLGDTTRQHFPVENRGGRSGINGSDLVAKSPPDGHTIMIHSATHIANAHLYKKLPYDTLADFVAVAPISAQVGMLVVHPSMPVKTVKELVALAKAKPGQIVYASSGNGSFLHLAMALLNATTHTRMIHVAYKGGGPAAVAIGSGEVQAMIGTIGSVVPEITAKRLRPVAVTSDYRVKAFADVPTIAESGVKGYEFTAWVGAFAPAGTPKPIVDKLNADIQTLLRMPDVAEKLNGQALDPMFMRPEAFTQRLKSDYEKYGKVIKLAGVTPE